ncbi:hypothetical protein [Paenibacillus wynnii]|uniref:hypothetical protein n=1 Tax=Paenibacillus wynnii TaxID=268407 RepID=UPI0027949045|nr:hypothetical protein [Paenibacillus wynnii]MDQ0192422.1 hypothetical protein [Paenibacillus wynnii]
MLIKKKSRSIIKKKHLVKKRKKTVIRKCIRHGRPVINIPACPPPQIHVAAPNVELTQPSPIVIPAPIVNVPACPPPQIHVAAPNVEVTPPAPIIIPAPIVNVPACPPPQIHVAAPNVELTQPSPIVIPAPIVNVPACPPPQIHVAAPNVEVNPPAPIVIPAPIVNVTTPENACETELRSNLLRFIGKVIEVIDSGGGGAGGSMPNQIGVLESVGHGTFAIRPTVGNPDAAQVVYYSIRQVIGFRPNVAVPSQSSIG